MKAGLVIGILIIGIGGYFYYKNVQANRGTIIPWQPVVFTYKDYKGFPGIDEPEFYEIVKQKNAAGGCNIYYTKYSGMPIEEVRKHINTDTDAMFEIFARRINERQLIQPIGIEYPDADYLLKKAASLGHVQSKLAVITVDVSSGKMKEEDAWKLLNKYEKITPVAVFEKISLLHSYYKTDYFEELQMLKKAGNYNYMIHIAVIADKYNDNTDLVCEAYFNGCDLYKYKTNNNIMCAD